MSTSMPFVSTSMLAFAWICGTFNCKVSSDATMDDMWDNKPHCMGPTTCSSSVATDTTLAMVPARSDISNCTATAASASSVFCAEAPLQMRRITSSSSNRHHACAKTRCRHLLTVLATSCSICFYFRRFARSTQAFV